MNVLYTTESQATQSLGVRAVSPLRLTKLKLLVFSVLREEQSEVVFSLPGFKKNRLHIVSYYDGSVLTKQTKCVNDYFAVLNCSPYPKSTDLLLSSHINENNELNQFSVKQRELNQVELIDALTRAPQKVAVSTDLGTVCFILEL